jgi:drug/metabolite transporter (DMT)-like permease
VAVFLLAVGAACCLGLGFVFQQLAAQHAPLSDFLSFRLLLDLARMPRWLMGMGFMICGMVLSTFALTEGELSLVEPLTATSLLFAMGLSRWLTGQRLGWHGWSGVLLLALGVTAFIAAGRPRAGGEPAGMLRHWLVIGVVAGLALLLVGTGKRLRPGPQATVLALAAGLLYGLQDALTRLSGQIVSHDGITALFVHWQPYALVAIGIFGLILVQSAFETAPLRMSLPALTAAQPLAGIACGVGFLGDQLRVTPGALAWQAVGLAAITGGVILLGMHPAMPCTKSNPPPGARLREAGVPAKSGR